MRWLTLIHENNHQKKSNDGHPSKWGFESYILFIGELVIGNDVPFLDMQFCDVPFLDMQMFVDVCTSANRFERQTNRCTLILKLQQRSPPTHILWQRFPQCLLDSDALQTTKTFMLKNNELEWTFSSVRHVRISR